MTRTHTHTLTQKAAINNLFQTIFTIREEFKSVKAAAAEAAATAANDSN